MAELNREQHELLAGAFSNDALFGGFISGMGGVYVPTKAEQVNGAHYNSVVNMLDSISLLLANVFRGCLYKDSADANNRFSMRPFSIPHRGMVCTYAGGTALGPLATGVNYIWADLTAAPVVTIGVGAALPATVHQPLGTIDMPASGHWLPANRTSLANRHLLSDVGLSKSIKRVLTFNDGGSGTLATVPAGTLIFWPRFIVTTTFDGTTPTLKIGDGVDDDRLMQVGDSNLAAAGHDYADRAGYYAAQTDVTYTLSTGGSTQGQIVVVLPQY